MTGRSEGQAPGAPTAMGLLDGELQRPDMPGERSDRAAAIVSAARKILESEGAEALTMRRVADALGIQAPSLYKHFANKNAIEVAIVTDAMVEIGEVTHAALHGQGPGSSLTRLLATYRAHCLQHAAVYRLATESSFPRSELPSGLEDWAGNPFFVVTGEPALAQALWSFAHGMVVLELDGRFPPGSDLDTTWRAGAHAFEQATTRS
jgi:AcrR family transcriptional regulator